MAADRIRTLTLSHVVLPLDNPVSDAKVLTGRQKPLTETVLLFVEVETEQGHRGMGFSYSKRAGGPAQYAHLKEVAEVAIGQDPSDIAKIYESLMWAGASVGRSGVATQAVAALDVALYDLKARRAGPARSPSCSAPTATPAGSTTPPAASCRRRSRRSRRRPPPRWSPASAASRSRSASPTGPRTCAGSRRCASTSATPRSWSTPTSSGTAPAPAGCAASSSSST